MKQTYTLKNGWKMIVNTEQKDVSPALKRLTSYIRESDSSND